MKTPEKLLDKESTNPNYEFLQLLNVLANGYRWLLTGVAIGILGGYIFFILVPSEYEATALIQPATIGTSSQVGAATFSKIQVEPTADTIERLKTPSFYNQDIQKNCRVSDPFLLAGKIKPLAIKASNLIQIQYRGNSPEIAERCINTVISQLKETQQLLSSPLIKTLEMQLALTKQQINLSEKFLKELDIKEYATHANISESSLLFLEVKSKREELIVLRKIYNDQSASLHEPLTQPLRLIEKTTIPERPVFPVKSISLFGGGVLGLFFALLALFIDKLRKKIK